MKDTGIALVVDDSRVNRLVLTRQLGSLGVEVLEAENGREALDLLRTDAVAVDVVLLDVMMPELDGPSTLRELRRVQSLEATPVIFMTARAQPEEVAEYRRLGALDVIVKPFDPMALGDQIRGIWSAQEAM
jgi:CheY-like chemotaxis protein